MLPPASTPEEHSSASTLHDTPGLSHNLHRAPTHDSGRADLSFPAQTTDVAQAGYTDEYRATTRTGLIRADAALRPIPSRVSATPTALLDAEKTHLKDYQLVTWKEGDPEDPRNWSKTYRWYITAVCALSVVQVAFASAVVTGDFRDIEEEFHVGEVTTALTVTLMVVGFGIGPLAWSPIVSCRDLFRVIYRF